MNSVSLSQEHSVNRDSFLNNPLYATHTDLDQQTSTVLPRGLPNCLQRLAAAIGLVLISPLLLLTILIIRTESRGSAVFTQVRVGENGRRFRIYKFRSMYMPEDPKYIEPDASQSDREGICQKFFSDPRITPVGKVIRKLSIDELPQLFNVVLGDMVLIGPRPALPNETDAYRYHMLQRLNCKPGLTGLWQVSGRADTTFDEQIDLDVRYVQQRSLWMDLRILLATFPAVLLGKGAY